MRSVLLSVFLFACGSSGSGPVGVASAGTGSTYSSSGSHTDGIGGTDATGGGFVQTEGGSTAGGAAGVAGVAGVGGTGEAGGGVAGVGGTGEAGGGVAGVGGTGEAGEAGGGATSNSAGGEAGQSSNGGGNGGEEGGAPSSNGGSVATDCVCSAGECCDGCHFLPRSHFCREEVRTSTCLTPSTLEQNYWNLFCDGLHAECTRWAIQTKTVDSPCPSQTKCKLDADAAACMP